MWRVWDDPRRYRRVGVRAMSGIFWGVGSVGKCWRVWIRVRFEPC